MQLAVSRIRFDVAALGDETLVELARRGDEDAIRILIKRHNQRLFRVARGVVRDDGEAEDIVQETYVRAFTSLESFRGEAQLSTWLTRIALNEALGRMRRRRPLAELAELDAGTGSDEGRLAMFQPSLVTPSPETEAARGQVRLVLEQAIDCLPELFRLVFILRDVEGMNIEETSAHLSIKPETVKTSASPGAKASARRDRREAVDVVRRNFSVRRSSVRKHGRPCRRTLARTTDFRSRTVVGGKRIRRQFPLGWMMRQRPGSAKGVMFITIEDKTGIANLVIWPQVFEKNRRVILGSSILAARGRIQREGDVVHLVARHLKDLSAELASVGERDAGFWLPHGRGVEFHHGSPTPDPRGLPPRGSKPRDIYVPDRHIDTIRVKPRDFR